LGVADAPVRSAEAVALLRGGPPSRAAFEAAANAAVRELTPPSDLHGSAAYRRSVAGTLVTRALEGAAAAAGGA
ncbi:MAG: xanthine dehydrogenase family protein subunit M, partial [Acidimicrobiia bacterium]